MIWSKRLEGTCAVPFDDGAGERRREITDQELGVLLRGIDLTKTTPRKRYPQYGFDELSKRKRQTYLQVEFPHLQKGWKNDRSKRRFSRQQT